MQAIILESKAGIQRQKWLVFSTNTTSSVELYVYHPDDYPFNNGGFLSEDEKEYTEYGDIINAVPVGATFQNKELEQALEGKPRENAYLCFSITYKHMFPLFGTRRKNGHDHDYQWSDQIELLHHCHLLQLCLRYAHSFGGMLLQQPIDLLAE